MYFVGKKKNYLLWCLEDICLSYLKAKGCGDFLFCELEKAILVIVLT